MVILVVKDIIVEIMTTMYVINKLQMWLEKDNEKVRADNQDES